MAARGPALQVVSSCPLRWDQLAGNDRMRFCGHCQQHVYNVANLTMDEAVALIQRGEGRVCMRLQRRADGTVITRDCLHLVRRARERLVATALGVAVAVVGFWTGMTGLRKAIDARFVPQDPPRCPPPPPAAPPESELPDPQVGPPFEQGGAGPRPRVLEPSPKKPKPRPPVIKPRRDESLDSLGLAGLKL